MKPLAPNTLIQNRYLVVHLIGKGGMGEVYLAVDQRLGSAVAVKRTYYAGDEMLGAAFEREAKILARLRHPVLPKVSDHFGENADQYLVMEHISGDDLSKRLETAAKPFPVSWVMFWADQLLDALSYLHSHEPPIIHRDIKPQNLKLTDENHIVLLDFGLSKDSTGNTIASEPGKSGSVVGYTPHFASMEQIRGTGTDARSDIYSLSATLYQLISNTVPADALSRADIMLGGSPDPIIPLSTANPEISPAVSNVILKGLEVSRERRFSSAAEMQRALRTAHSQIQNQMSAETQVFTVGDIHATVPPMTDPTAPLPPSEMATRTPTVQPIEQVQDVLPDSPNLEATVQMSDPFGDKTEVMIDAASVSVIEDAPAVESNIPAETVAFAAPVVDGVANQPVTEEFAADPNVAVTDNVAPSATAPPASPNSVSAEVAKPAVYAATASASPKKAGGSKAGLILGGLAAVFLLVIAALGGGWYYYANYIEKPAASSTPTQTPAPSPSPTVTATPEATPDTNSNSASPTPTGSPTPAQDDLEPTGPRSQATPAVRDTAPKPPKTPGAKATPKTKPKDDRTIILQ